MTASQDRRRVATLRALAEVFVRDADAALAEAVAAFLATGVSEPGRAGLVQLLDLMGKLGLARLPRVVRERVVLPGLRRVSADVAYGIDALRTIILLVAYGDGAPNRRSAALGIPGPPPRRGVVSPPLPTTAPDGDRLDADVVVVGSGAGGSVIAAELAAAGLAVVVLEAGLQYTAADFPDGELAAFAAMYWRGHYQRSADGIIALAAGATLGGGTTVNWSNCYRTPDEVRAEWARHGLDDVATAAFDEHLDAVARRFGVTDAVSDDHGSNAVLRRGAERLGLATRRTSRNADATRYDPVSAGHMGLGDRSGSKLATPSNYLRDAVDAGARIVVGCRAEHILTAGGRARGVRATLLGGASARTLTVHAPTVVVAGGAIETPALLLRSGIGGPATGRHLRLHPVVGMLGLYAERVEPWRGGPQTTQVTSHLFRDGHDGHGFLLECPAFHPGLWASVMPFHGAREHAAILARAAHLAPILARIRERGSGRVAIDERGEASVTYPMSDALDRRHVAEALGVLARVHEAAGAEQIFGLGSSLPGWRRGDDLSRFIATAVALPIVRGGRGFMSAHQMGSARMGTDPATSAADVRGELHSTRGVWIGDTSAFPTATGANPMWTVMALARRTAHTIVAGQPR